MKYPIVNLHCFHVVGLSIAAAFEPVIIMEHEAIIGAFKCLYWLLKHAITHQLTFNFDLMQDNIEALQTLLHHESVTYRALPSVSCWPVSGPCHKKKTCFAADGPPFQPTTGLSKFSGGNSVEYIFWASQPLLNALFHYHNLFQSILNILESLTIELFYSHLS